MFLLRGDASECNRTQSETSRADRRARQHRDHIDGIDRGFSPATGATDVSDDASVWSVWEKHLSGGGQIHVSSISAAVATEAKKVMIIYYNLIWLQF